MTAPPDPQRTHDLLLQLRQSYRRGALLESNLAPDWLSQLRAWIDEAVGAGILEPNAMVLATATAHGRPNARAVLLRGLDERGLRFFTNYRSTKARELEANPRAAAVFPWIAMGRQVVAAGTVHRLSVEESDAYFASRPRGRGSSQPPPRPTPRGAPPRPPPRGASPPPPRRTGAATACSPSRWSSG